MKFLPALTPANTLLPPVVRTDAAPLPRAILQLPVLSAAVTLPASAVYPTAKLWLPLFRIPAYAPNNSL